ncbi:rho GTPase-activating protein gacO-like [Mytilus californianus]|uniref:rho GTPase-activating protein gacO-like n=1 Tax=Mytilus californianus TaxID=6549 RepID=UPI0022469D40|nr:rho GTPase-activating protein gacO-like [Mytilus californianus]
MTNTTESAAIDSNDSNIWPIVGAVLGGLLVISLLLIILYCLLRKKKVPDAKDDLVKVEDGLDGEESDDESIPSIEYPETWDTPTKDPIGPLRRYVTRDMMSQTELLKKLKNIAFREPEKPPTPPPPPPPPTPPPKTPPPKYMPWPWRTAKRASEKTMYQSEFPMKKVGPVSGSKQDNGNLADYTISKYGIKYDDTGIPISDKKLSRQATKFIPPSKSFVGMSTESSVISRSNSLPSLKESQSTQTRPPTRNSSHDESFYRSQSMEDIQATSTTDLDSQVVSTIDPLSMQDIQIPTPSTTFNSFAPPKGTQLLLNINKPVINTGVSSASLTKDIQTPALKRIQMYRALSTGSIGTFSDRTQTEILMEEEKRINETDGVNKTEIINDRDRPSIMDKTKQYIKKVPHYMFPIRSNSLTKFDKKINKNPLSQTLPRSKTDMIPLSDKINRPKKNTLKKKKKKIKKTKNSPYLDSLTPRAQPPIVTLSQKKGYNNKVKPVDSNKKRKSKTNANFNTGSPSNKSTTTENDNTPEKYQPSPNLGMKSETFVRKQEDAELIPATTDFLHRMKSSATDFQDSGISADESSLDRQRSYCATKLPSITTHSEVGNNEQQKNDEQIKLPHLETKQKSYVRPWR